MTALGRSSTGFGAGAGRRLVSALLLLVSAALPGLAAAEKEPPPREARLEWDEARRYVQMGVSFRDIVDAGIKKKLSRGLPTTIVLTATVFRAGTTEPLSTTAQTCKVTWHVWDEVYLLEITRPGLTQTKPKPTATVEGVLRRCAEVSDLIIGDHRQIPLGTAIYLQAKVQVNPVSSEVLNKLKRWVSRPSGTGTAAPGDALFSTFTGLFLQRIGEAERQLLFSTRPEVPKLPPKPKP